MKKDKTDYGTYLGRALRSKCCKILEELKIIVKIDSETHSGLLSLRNSSSLGWVIKLLPSVLYTFSHISSTAKK